MAEKNNIITWTIVLKDGEFVAKLKNTGGLLREANGQFAKTTVSVEELGNATKKLGSDMVVSEKQIKSEIAALKQLQQTVQIGSEEYRRLGSAMTQLKGQQQGLKDGSIGLASSLKGVSQSSGAAAATTLELGRVISDAPYGIRGMANNVSQVASQMAFMSRSTDIATGKVLGFSGAVKAVWQSMLGPLGILLAIQTAIALLDHFAGGMKKSAEATETLTDKIDEQNKSLEENIRLRQLQLAGLTSLINSFSGTELFTGIFESGIEESGKYEAALTELSDRLGALGSKDAKYLKDINIIQSDRIVIAGNLLEIEKQRQALLKERLKVDTNASDREKLKKQLADGEISNLLYTNKLQSLGVETLDESLKIQKEIKRLNDANAAIIAKTVEIKPDKDGGKSAKAFKENLLDLSKETDSFNKREEERFFQFESTKLEIQRKFQKLALEDTYEDFKTKEQLRFDNFVKSQAARHKITEEQYLQTKEGLDAQLVLTVEMGQAELEYKGSLMALENAIFQERLENIKKFDLERALLAKQNQQTLKDIEFNEDIQGQLNEKTVGKRGVDTQKAEKQDEEGSQLQRDALASIEFLNIGLEAAFIDDEARAELLLQKEQREKEYLAGAKMRSDAKILLDQLELESKQRLTNDVISLLGSASEAAGKSTAVGKALAIASTTISTYDAAQKAYNSQIVVGDPTSVPRAVIAAAASVASGLLKVKQILAVKIPNQSGGGGSAPAQQGRTFDFNLVGSTGQNQLAQTIGGQVGQTIRAYVVGSEITNQQQFDSQIQGEATIG